MHKLDKERRSRRRSSIFFNGLKKASTEVGRGGDLGRHCRYELYTLRYQSRSILTEKNAPICGGVLHEAHIINEECCNDRGGGAGGVIGVEGRLYLHVCWNILLEIDPSIMAIS
jgi:hypothetical protein